MGFDFCNLSCASIQASARAIVALSEEQQEEVKKKPGGGKRGPKWINPVAANFKRTKQGRALMVQEVTRLVHHQSKVMPNKAVLDLNNKEVSWEYKGDSGCISVQELCHKAPIFFDHFFSEVRNKLMFGAKIQAWIASIDKALGEYNSKPLMELVYLISASQFASTVGFQDESSDED